MPALEQIVIPITADLVHQKTGGAGTANFTGVAPDGVRSTTPSGFAWAAGVNQGLVDPEGLGLYGSYRAQRIQLVMAGQSTWAVTLEDGTGSVAIANGTTETSKYIENVCVISPGQKLKVVTTGGGTTLVKMTATLSRADRVVD